MKSTNRAIVNWLALRVAIGTPVVILLLVLLHYWGVHELLGLQPGVSLLLVAVLLALVSIPYTHRSIVRIKRNNL